MSEQDMTTDWKLWAWRAAISQGPSFVMLCAICYGLYNLGYYVIDVGVPMHLKAIQEGYERMEKVQDLRVRELQLRHSEDIVRLTTSIDRLVDLAERREKAANQ